MEVLHTEMNLHIAVFIVFLLLGNVSCGSYSMKDYCGMELSLITAFEYQIRLKLNDDLYNYRVSHTCETTIEAWYTYPKLMFYFEDFNIDCEDGHLEFYRGSNSDVRVKGLETDICGDSKPEGVFEVDDRYFRVKYDPKKNQALNPEFAIIITAFSDDSCPGYAYKCSNSRCISDEIRCNGYDSCGDDSGCNLEVGAIVGIVIGSVAGLALIVSTVICCYCCFRKSGLRQGTVQGTVATAGPVGYAPGPQAVYGVNQANFGGSPYPTNQVPIQQTGFPSQNYSTPGAFSGFTHQGS